MIRVFSLIILAMLFAEKSYSAECGLSIAVSGRDVRKCEAAPSNDEKKECLRKIFGKSSQITLSKAGKFQVAITNSKAKPVCINDLKIAEPGTLMRISLTQDENKVCIDGFGSFTSGPFVIQNTLICFEIGGKFPNKLSPLLGYIPVNTKVTLQKARVTADGFLETEYGLVLNEPAQICGMKMPKGSDFGSYEADEQYHFVADVSGKMKVVRKNGETEWIKIVKGQKYGNPHPREFPCDWSETIGSTEECTMEQVMQGDCSRD